MTAELTLDKTNRILIARAFKSVPRVDMAIDCVIEGQMGMALVDDADHPRAFKLELGPFFYFAGEVESGQELLAAIAPYTLFMPSGPRWIEAAQVMYGQRLVGFERYSFSDEGVSLDRLKQLVEASPWQSEVKQMDLDFARRLWGQEHFVDLSAYDSPEDFVRRGVGFYLQVGTEIAGAAYASLACSRGIEVSLYVEENYRRQGAATVLSSRLLKWAREHHAQANWDAANPESCKLAEKLGYYPAGTYQAYYLKPEE